MALRKHTNKTYYYRTKRAGGRVVNEYLGRSPQIAQLAQSDAARVESERLARERWEYINYILDTYEYCVRVVLEANLVVNGYYKHHGQWRKKRVKKSSPKAKQANR